MKQHLISVIDKGMGVNENDLDPLQFKINDVNFINKNPGVISILKQRGKAIKKRDFKQRDSINSHLNRFVQ